MKSPSELRKWRLEKEERDAKLKKKYEEHEKQMMKWAALHAKTGPNIICPDGKVRTVPHHIFIHDPEFRCRLI